MRTLRDSDSDDANHRERQDNNAPPRLSIDRDGDREADRPSRVRPTSRPDAEAGNQQPPEEGRPWGPDNIRGVFPWKYITGESRAWIRYVEGSYGSSYRWCRPRPPTNEPHCRAMSASSTFKKGIFYDRAGPPLRPAYLGHSPGSTVTLPGNPEWFVLPFFCTPGRSFSDFIEPYTPFDPRFIMSRPRDDLNQDQLRLHYRNASLATMVYLCGQVRLGDKQCQRCQQRRITTNMPGEAIPVCATAGRYFHGVCANCLAKGGTLSEMLERCSVSSGLSFQDYDQLSRGRGDPGWVGRSPFIGDNATDLAFARNLLWRKALPSVPRSSPGTATASGQNSTAEGNRDNVIAGSSTTAEVGGPMAPFRRPSGAGGRSLDNAVASSSTTAEANSSTAAPRRLSGARDGNRSTATTGSPAMGTSRSQITGTAASENTAVARTPGTAVGRSQNAGMARTSATAGSPSIITPGKRSTVIPRRPSETR